MNVCFMSAWMRETDMDKDRVRTDKEKNKVCVLVFSNENLGSGGGQVVSVLAFTPTIRVRIPRKYTIFL